MHCPVCKVPLREEETGGIELHFCGSCGGLLCTSVTFREHVAALRESGLEELSTPELLGRKVIPQFAIRPEQKECPGCGRAMKQFNYAYDSNIILDRCVECGLVWADRGEIVKVAQYVKGNPKIDRLGEALADREAERAWYRDMVDNIAESRQAHVAPVPFWFGVLPISDEEESRTIPVVTLLIILVNIALFLILPQSDETFESLGFIPQLFLAGRELYRVITSQFVHIGLLHLVGNVLFLWIFGDNVEDRFGKIAFLLAYLFFGTMAAVSHAFLTTHTHVPCLGASGAISGVMGSYFILFPQSRIRTIIGRWIVRVPAFILLGGWFGLQLLFSAYEESVAYYAHIGGFVSGAVVALAFRSGRELKKV